MLAIDPFDYPAMRTPISLALFFCFVLAGFASASAQELSLTEIYRVGAGDVLDIRLLNAANHNSTLFTVDGGGVIDLPVAGGSISVAGLTTEEIQTRIAAELKRRAVEENAKVSVGVRQYLSHSVTVTGLVVHPGTRFLRRERVPLYVVLAESQLRNDGGRVVILRAGSRRTTSRLERSGDAESDGSIGRRDHGNEPSAGVLLHRRTHQSSRSESLPARHHVASGNPRCRRHDSSGKPRRDLARRGRSPPGDHSLHHQADQVGRSGRPQTPARRSHRSRSLTYKEPCVFMPLCGIFH